VLVVGAQKDPNRAPPELKISLSSTQAPKIAMKSAVQTVDDEPFGWECREALREFVIGKAVDFKVDYAINDRQMGTLKLQGKNVAEYLIERGLAKVVTGQRASPELDDLQTAEKEAQSKGLGQWGNKGGAPRQIAYSTDDDFDGKSFVAKHKGKKFPCIVEWVRDAGHCRVLLLPGKGIEKYTLIGCSFAGLQVEGFKRDPETREEKAEGPTSAKAKYFLEFRVLNRNLEVRLEATDTFGNIYGTLYHPKGVISKFLVQEGYAKVGGPSLGDTESASELRELMKEAQQSKKGRWAGYEAPALGGKKEFMGKVLEIISGDCLVVKDLDTEEERRIYFSSTKAPKPARRDTKDEPFAFEAREFLRKKFVGKKVKVAIDYTREPMGPGGTAPTGMMAQMGTMFFASIFERTTNVAAEVIAKGYALYQRHRSDDETSEHLDDLIAAEKSAEEKQLGQHGKAPAPVYRYNDLVGAENSSKAKAMAGSLKRMGKVDGVAEFVFNAGRFKVRIDRENLFVPFVLAGVRVPQTARMDRKKAADPFANEAVAFARENVLQSDIQIEVHDTDKGGNCLGSIWYKVQLENGKTTSKLWAEALLEQGFAQTVDFSLAGVPYATQLLAAEEKAKTAQLGVWSLPEDTMEMTTEKARTIPAVEVVHINGVADFYVQEYGDPAMERITQAVASSVKGISKPTEVKRNMLVLCEFQGDWYRAQVLSISPGGQCEVVYVDYGNSDSVHKDKVRTCPSSLSLQAEPQRAIHCCLAGLKTTSDYEQDAGMCFQSFAQGTFKCQIEAVYSGFGQAILTNNNGVTLNERIVKEGLARVDPRTRTACKAVLEKEQTIARRSRLFMWRHGDNYDDDEEERDLGAGRF
jgi:staphylococcal nuclease domain-containing protein 1